MSFLYHFPAVKGKQAEREYYISMVPLKFLPRLFSSENEIVLSEHKAQRRIDETKIQKSRNTSLKTGILMFSLPFRPKSMVSIP